MVSQSPPLKIDAPIAAGGTSFDWLPGGGAAGALIRRGDWGGELGPPSTWPQSLRTALNICLLSKFPMAVCWGPSYRIFYSDAYAPILGAKHPEAMGRPCFEVWAELAHIVKPMFDGVIATGEATWSDDLMLPMHRHGYLEEAYFTVSYSAIRAEAKAEGILVTVTETTERYLAERRLALLRELGDAAGAARTPRQAAETAGAIIGRHPADLPFALLYAVSRDEKVARLVAHPGLAAGSAAAPPGLPLEAAGSAPWPVHRVFEGGREVVVDIPAAFDSLPGRLWPESARQAVLLPITRPGGVEPVAVLVAGVNPRRALDDRYHEFLRLVAGQISNAMANAMAHEEARSRAEALAELDRAKTAFFSNVSHEFRTPLTLMLGPLEQALRESQPGRESLEVAHRNSLRLLKLVNTLLDFSRIEAGRVDASYEPTDLSGFTAELASVFRSAVEKAGLRLRVDCPPLPEAVFVDRDMWEKIVFNLLSNALKFTFEGEIAISVQPVRVRDPNDSRPRQACLTVRDTGTGIPAVELPRIFERFHRVRTSRSRSHEGTGIGLALVQELVRLHGGTVGVESTEGKGTTFKIVVPFGTAHLPPDRVQALRVLPPTVTGASAFIEEVRQWLPDHSAPQALARADSGPTKDPARSASVESLPPHQANANATRHANSNAPRVLLVDDNADMRAYLRGLLENRGYAVVTANDGHEALAAVRTHEPDLVLSDIMMPSLDGFGLLRQLRDDPRTQAVPVILLSARAGEEERLEGVGAGADDYLTKPFSARELIARVETHLKLAQLRREAAAASEAERRRLHEILLGAPAIVCVLRGPQHIFELANQHYVALIGRRDAAEILSKPIREALPELAGQVYYEILDRVYATGEPFIGKEMPVKLERAGTGGPLEERVVNFVYQPTRDLGGKVDGILVHATDVTDMVRDRQRLEELTHRLAAERDRTRSSEQHLRAIVETTPECVKIVAGDGTLLEMNSAGLGMVEAACRADVLGKNIYEVIAPDFRDRFRDFNERVCRGESGTLAFDIVGLSGTRRHMETTGAPLRLADGNVAQLAITRDVTARRQTEQALRESEERFRAFVTASSDVIYRMSADWAEMRHLDGKEFVADTLDPTSTWLEKYIHPDDQPRLTAAIREAVRTKTTFELEHRVIRADGTLGWTFSRAIPLFDEYGNLREWFGAATDVTERKRVQDEIEKLRAQSDRQRRLFHAVLASTPDLAYVFDLDHRFIYANEALLKMWGRTWQEAVGKTCLELGYEPWHAEMHDREIDLVVRTKQPIRGEVPFTGTSGRRIYDYIFVPVLGEDGEVEAVAGTTRDVTDMVQARETVARGREELERLVGERTDRLQRAVEQMEEFSYSVSHDLRSPVRAMCGYAEALLEEHSAQLTEEGRELLTRIQRSGTRMDRLIRDLLTYSRIARREMGVEPVSLERLLHEVVQQYPDLQSDRAKIEIAPGLPWVRAHEPSLTQALSNLLSNAVKFVAPGVTPHVRISCHREAGIVRLWVADNGIGIPPELQSRLFGMFERVHPDLSYEGTGIGLAIVRKAVERMNGRVGLESDGTGGCRFWIELPEATP